MKLDRDQDRELVSNSSQPHRSVVGLRGVPRQLDAEVDTLLSGMPVSDTKQWPRQHLKRRQQAAGWLHVSGFDAYHQRAGRPALLRITTCVAESADRGSLPAWVEIAQSGHSTPKFSVDIPTIALININKWLLCSGKRMRVVFEASAFLGVSVRTALWRPNPESRGCNRPK
ncbi:hypothetical protein ACKWRH_06175 [Bradyrhizobium sp. Pa8]|uniref:hypothetical protein n=1 Tax=Bradyrhizobium sp. Pa8 TaxID=3386552 RepID=UPI00403F6D6E